MHTHARARTASARDIYFSNSNAISAKHSNALYKCFVRVASEDRIQVSLVFLASRVAQGDTQFGKQRSLT